MLEEKISFESIHLMGTFFNPKTRKMKHLSQKQRDECIEYMKQEMLIFDADQHIISPTRNKIVSISTINSCSYMTDFYLSTENNDDESAAQQSALRASSYEAEIELYLKHETDQVHVSTAAGQQTEEHNSLDFWKKKHSSYPILAKVAARVLGVPATSATVEREFNFTGNVITQKRSRLSPDTVNDITVNHSHNIYKKKLVTEEAKTTKLVALFSFFIIVIFFLLRLDK